MNDNELAVQPEQSLVKPVGSSQELTSAIQSYKEMQSALDAAMPDCIMEIQGKKFRKKNYWRGVKTAFNLKVECWKEEKVYHGEDDWGYHIIYRATAPNGATADGDGACTYSEKAQGNMKASDHNIRSQAHTRAFNRAVSNLVGFGEVSAEEVNREDVKKGTTKQSSGSGDNKLTEEQQKLWNTLVQYYGADKEKIKSGLKIQTSFPATKDMGRYKKGDMVEGKESVKDMSDKFAKITRKKLEKLIEDQGSKSNNQANCQECAEMPECEREPSLDCGFFVKIIEGEVIVE